MIIRSKRCRGTIMKVLGLWLGLSVVIHGAALAQDNAGKSAGPEATQNTPEAHMGAGYENLRNNRYEAAAHEFRAALALNPKLVLQAQFPLAVALFELH